MIVLNLVRVFRADFRRSDITIFSEFASISKKIVERLKQDDVIAFVSKSDNQIMFIRGFESVFTDPSQKASKRILMSVRIRIDSGQFDPRMLANYAEQANIRILNRKRYEEYFQQRLEMKKQKQR